MRLRAAGVGVAVGLGILAGAPASGAQQPPRIPHVGFLHAGSLAGSSPFQIEAFRKGLRELGYVEGQNIALELRGAEGKLERLPELVADLVRLKVDVLVAPTPQAAGAARRATTTTPIVFVVVGDPVATGLVASMARPGGNLTGLTLMGVELGEKRLELLKEVVPGLARVAVLWNPTVPDKVLEWKVTEGAARALGIELLSLEVRGPADFEGAFKTAARWRPGGLVVLPEPLMFTNRTRIQDFAGRSRLPTMFAWRESAEAGALISYGPSLAENYRRAATYVHKILKGAKPADLPVEQPTRFELVVNQKTAKALGLTFPPSILVRADKVIE